MFEFFPTVILCKNSADPCEVLNNQKNKIHKKGITFQNYALKGLVANSTVTEFKPRSLCNQLERKETREITIDENNYIFLVQVASLYKL